MVKRYAVLDEAGRCVNVILWDGVTPFTLPAKHTILQDDTRQVEPAPVSQEQQALEAKKAQAVEDLRTKLGITEEELALLRGQEYTKKIAAAK